MKVLEVLAVVATVLSPAALRADVYELKDGGEVVGETVERIEGGDLLVRTADGALVTLERKLLARVVNHDDAMAEYITRSRAAPDTADAHRELAAWCRERKLLKEADIHLARLAELDPNDEEARRSLGQMRVGDRWLTADQLMVERGMRFYEGKYRTAQDIAIRERNKEEESANIDWFKQLRTWRGWLDHSRADRAAEAHAQFSAISDPQAAPAIVRLLEDEEDAEVFELVLLRTLGGLMDHPVAVRTMVDYTLDPDIRGEIREQCLEYLTRDGRQVHILPYVQALKDKDNRVVNRAGYALGRIADPAAISPLIDALVTTHKYQVQPDSGGGDQIVAGFSPSGGGGGLSVGGNGPQIVRVDEQNERVLQALMKLSGNQNFEYDEQAWRAWFVDLQMRQRINSRRDE